MKHLLKLFAIGLIVILLTSCQKEKDATMSTTPTDNQLTETQKSDETLTSDAKVIQHIESFKNTDMDQVKSSYKDLIVRINNSTNDPARQNTAGLLESIVNSEFLSYLHTRDDLQSGFNWFLEINDAMKKLVEKDDLSETVINFYNNFQIEGWDSNASLVDQGRHSIKLLFLETFIAQDYVISGASDQQLNDLINQILLKTSQKSNYPEVYGYFSNSSGAFALARILSAKKNPELENQIRSNQDLSTFMSQGHLLEPSTMELIFSMAGKQN